MNRDDVIRMAREVGLHLPYWADDEDPEIDPPRWTMVSPLPLLLERFAAAAYAAGAAAEREEILTYAKSEAFNRMHGERSPYAHELVNYISARGQT